MRHCQVMKRATWRSFRSPDEPGPTRFAVYRIALGGFNLTRMSRDRAAYKDYTRHLADR